MENLLNTISGKFFIKANCKLAEDPSGIVNSAQPSAQAKWHMPLNGGFWILSISHATNRS